MAKNNIDFKQLLLDKGEKIGMGAAMGVMVVLVVAGSVSAINSDNPATIAEDIAPRRPDREDPGERTARQPPRHQPEAAG